MKVRDGVFGSISSPTNVIGDINNEFMIEHR